MRHAVIAVVWIGLLAHTAIAQQPPDDVERLREEIDQLVDTVLETWQENRVDYVNDTPAEVAIKRQAIRRALQGIDDAVFADFFDDTAFALNYIMYRNTASPHLSGAIIRVGTGADQDVATLVDAMSSVAAGDLILLGPGTYTIGGARSNGPQRFSWNDVAIIGAGRDVTTLTGTFEYGTRMRIEGVTFDCKNTPVTDLDNRNGPFGLHLRDVHITNYNSGAGGSNAVYFAGGTVLIEQCTFEGMTGRAARPGSGGGNAFDIRGSDNFLWLRQTQFIDNAEITRSVDTLVVDGCVSMNCRLGIMSDCYTRDNQIETNMRGYPSTPFVHATDDRAFVDAVVNGTVDALGAQAQLVAEQLELDRNLRYWIGLLRHEDVANRRYAVTRLQALLPTVEIPNHEKVIQDDAGTLRDLGPLFAGEVAFATLFNWYEKNRARLQWDAATGSYALKDAADAQRADR